ncbi:hypothetical protein DL96DRAFT_1551315 [Flagelloscypha sp. PMI_526]|nr:hypothetical protein DL96DRAFT_1551315 [Flagelloscypha sp. PMI_526]
MSPRFYGASLPSELLSIIFSFSSLDRESQKTLRHCCLVSRRFCAIAQPILFISIDLSECHESPELWEEDVMLFQDAIFSNPCLGAYVENLSFLILSTVMPEFADLLLALQNLRELSLYGLDKKWDVIPSEVQAVLFQTVFPKLSSLHLTAIEDFPLYHSHGTWQNLQRLSLLRNEENALDFIHKYCAEGLGQHLRQLYLCVEVFGTYQSHNSKTKRRMPNNFLDLRPLSQLEHLYFEIPAFETSGVSQLKILKGWSPFFFRLAKTLGYRRKTRDDSFALRSLTFADVLQFGDIYRNMPFKTTSKRAWSAFDEVLMDRTMLPMLERVTYGKASGRMRALKRLLPRASGWTVSQSAFNFLFSLDIVKSYHLPIDLLPEIFSFLPFDPKDFGTTREHDYREKDFTLFQNLLTFTPSLAKDVSYIAFPSTKMEQFADLLVSLVNLQGLSIDGDHNTWDATPLEIQNMVLRTVFPRLSTLRIARMDTFPVLDVFRMLSNIQELFLYYIITAPPGDFNGQDDQFQLPLFRCLILEGYDNDDLDPPFSHHSLVTHSQCKPDTLVLREPSGNAGNMLTFFHELCLVGMSQHLRTLYLSDDFFRVCQCCTCVAYGPDNEYKSAVKFFDLLAVPDLEDLYVEVLVDRLVFDKSNPSNPWEHMPYFFLRLAEMLGHGRENWGRSMPLRSINFVKVECEGTLEYSKALDRAWTALDQVLVNKTLLPALEKVVFEKAFGSLDALRTLLPRAMDTGLVSFGAVLQSFTIWR